MLAASTTTTAWKSFRNLPSVHVITPGELNTYDVLVSDYVVFSRETLPAATPSRRQPAATPRTRAGPTEDES